MSATADGMLTPLQRTQMQANAWGALCMMHRQYLPNMIQERLTMKNTMTIIQELLEKLFIEHHLEQLKC